MCHASLSAQKGGPNDVPLSVVMAPVVHTPLQSNPYRVNNVEARVLNGDFFPQLVHFKLRW